MIFVRREDKGAFERRAPLTPGHVARLTRERGIPVTVEPSPVRAFSDAAYRGAGAVVSATREHGQVVLGVKEVSPERLERRAVYAFFPHVTKGQTHNRDMLRRILELECTLIDYEEIADESGRRLVFFGRQAGQAGAIDSLWALGRRFGAKGHETPFLDVHRAFEYTGLEDAKRGVAAAGERIAREGLPPKVCPLVLGVAGYGNTAQGALEIFRLLPFEEVPPQDVAGRPPDRHTVSLSVFREEDTVTPVDPDVTFDLAEFRSDPARYRSRFDATWPYVTLLLNGVLWRPGCPRLLSRDSLSRLYPGSRLEVIGDVSCDVRGAVECTVRVTTPDDPVYVYETATGHTPSGVEGEGPVVLAVDNLPCELPVEASRDFGDALLPFVPALAECDWGAAFPELVLPEEIRRAIVVNRGTLTPAFARLKEIL